MKKITFVLICVPLLISSCAALTRYKCNREYAVKKGMEDAEAGRISQPSRTDGSSCEGDYSGATFSKDYLYGFQQKKNEICQVTMAAQLGKTDGEQGNTGKPSKGKLSLCSDTKNAEKLQSTYEKEFKKSYCSNARASNLGSARAQAWQEEDYSTTFADCGNNASLRSSYLVGYKKALAENCTLPGAEKYAMDEARANHGPEEGVRRLTLCSGATRLNLVDSFRLSYERTKNTMAREENDRIAREREAQRAAQLTEFQRSVATSSFPMNLRNYVSRCSVTGNRSQINVEIENQYPEQVLIQGNWRVIYYNNDFAKITEDRTLEAVLITGNNKKSFQKLTLPQGAAYCRAEFLGG